MKTKLEMAHEWYMMQTRRNGCALVADAWKYADAMQAAADNREKEQQSEHVFEAIDDWQPDWSQAPDNAMYWAMDGCGQCNWYEREPEVCGSQWDFGSVIEQADTGYDYQGDWRNSLRKRLNDAHRTIVKTFKY